MSTFIQALNLDINTNWGTVPVYFGTPQEKRGEFVVMLIVNAGERPDVLCEDQGEAGQVDLQFSGVAASEQAAYNLLESLKNYVQSIAGQLTVDSDTFQVNENITDGVRGFDASLGAWQAIFESRFAWHEI